MGYLEKRQGKKGITYRLIVSQGMDAEGMQRRATKTWKPPKGMKPEKIEPEAYKQLALFEQEVENGYCVKEWLFAEYIEHYFDLMEIRKLKLQTIREQRDCIKIFLAMYEQKKIAKITPADIAAYIKYLQSDNIGIKGRYYKPLPGIYSVDLSKYNFHHSILKNLTEGGRVQKKTAEQIEQTEGKTLFEVVESRCNLSETVQKNYIAAVNRIFKQAAKERIIKYNPFDVVQIPRFKKHRRQAVEREDIKKLLNAADHEPPRITAIIYLFAYSGARRGEIYGLTWQDIDTEGKTININKAVARSGADVFIDTTKTGASRVVPLPDIVFEKLTEYKKDLLSRGKLSPVVFAGASGSWCNPGQIYFYLQEIAKRYNLEYIHPHRFRHTAASLLISEGVDVLTVAEMLGHRDIETTLNVYSHALEEKKRETSDTMQRLLNA